MSIMNKLALLGAGVAVVAAATPASAQYYGYAQPYSSPRSYGYAQPYGYGQSYGYANTDAATQQCTAAVQSRLYNRQSVGGILGVLLGANTPAGRVVGVTQVSPRGDGMIRVRGLASSGRYVDNGYGPYGVGAYGSAGYRYANSADLSFRCDVAPNGAVYSVDINRR